MEGYIAFLDILGFSHSVGRDGFDEKLERFLSNIKDAVKDNSPSPQFAITSDSIILTTQGNDLDHLRSLVSTVSPFQYNSLMNEDLAIRGGITFGNFQRSVDSDGGVLVAGREVVAAYLLEQSQDWLGVVLAPSIIERNRELQDYFNTPRFNNEGHVDELRRTGYANGQCLLPAMSEFRCKRSMNL
jgi:hypothetical protein